MRERFGNLLSAAGNHFNVFEPSPDCDAVTKDYVAAGCAMPVSHAYQNLVGQFRMQASRSRRANCFGNAPIELFCGTLKSELVYHRRFATRDEAKRAISEYIEMQIFA